MLLREELMEYTKEELLDIARDLEIKKCSGLKKADLAERISKEFCTEKMLRSRLSCLTDEEFALFRKACAVPQKLAVDDVMSGMQLYNYLTGSFDEITDEFFVFEDVAENFNKIDDTAFLSEQHKKGWMMKCLQFFESYYGIAPAEVMYDLYRHKVQGSIEDMLNTLDEMPLDITATCIFSMESLGMSDWPETDPVYSRYGLFVHLSILEDEEFDYLLKRQMGKSFCIPSASLIEETCRFGYETGAAAYQLLKEYFMNELSISAAEATTWCLRVWENSYDGESPTEIINEMSDEEIVFDSEQGINTFMKLLMDAHNNTRMKENRGHKPNELSGMGNAGKGMNGKMPTIMPGSSFAAQMLKEAAPQLEAMGIPVDLDSNADVIPAAMFPNGLDGEAIKVEKKVYPNDSCPCGSGKKYKKCCGRNR